MAKYEKDEYVFVKADSKEARVIRVFENGDVIFYEVVFDASGWHKMCREEEIEKSK